MTFPWASGPVLGTLISGVIIIGVFCVWEWKGAGLPIVPSKFIYLLYFISLVPICYDSVYLQKPDCRGRLYCDVYQVRFSVVVHSQVPYMAF